MKKMKKETQLLLPLTACNVWMSWPTSWRGQGGTTTGATEPPLGGNWEDICKAGTCHYQIGWRTKVQDLLWCSSGMQALTTSNQLKNKRRKEGRKGYHLYLKIQPQMLVTACLRINIFSAVTIFLWETPRNRWGKPEKTFAVFIKNLEKRLLLLSIDPYNSCRLYEFLFKAKALEDKDPNLIPMTDPWDDYIGRSLKMFDPYYPPKMNLNVPLKGTNSSRKFNKHFIWTNWTNHQCSGDIR